MRTHKKNVSLVNKLKSKLSKLEIQKFSAVIIIAAVAIIGIKLIASSHAQSPYASVVASSGTLSGAASIVTDPSASTGQKVQFGSSTPTSSFVQVCGLKFCINGTPFTIHGATAYGEYSDPTDEIALAKEAGINTLELVEFDCDYHVLSDTESTCTWDRVDQFIAAAQAAGIHVILNLSEYGQSLIASGITPTTYDWNSYLSFIANRTNTVTGVEYKNDPTIAMVELYGEIDAPNYGINPGLEGTTAQMTTFFQQTLAQWVALAPNVLVSTGGFSYLNDPNSGIDWQAIMNDPNDASCDMEVNSPQDEDTSVANVTSYCQGLNKPWFLAAWSSCYQDSGYPFSLSSDSAMATHAQAMYDIASGAYDPEYGGTPETYPAIGTDFWDLQDTTVSPGTCSIGTQFPLTFAVVQNTAP